MKGVLYLFVCYFLLAAQAFGQYKQYESGLEYYKKQEYDKAIVQFTEYFKKPGRDKKIDVEVHYYAALSHYRKRDYSGAMPGFREAISLNHSNSGNIYWFLAKCHEKLGQHDPAITAYTQAINILRSDNAAYSKLLFERGQVYLQANNKVAAKEDFTLAATINPDDESIQQELARLGKPGTETPSAQQTVLARDTPKEKPPVSEKKESAQENKQPVNQVSTTTEPVKTTSRNEKEQKLTVTSTNTNTSRENETNASKEKDVVSNSAPPPSTGRSSALRNLPDAQTTDSKPSGSNTVAEKTTAAPEPQPAVKTQMELLAEAYKNEKRYALIIGNANYPKSIGALRNPVNDATDLAKELQNSNFEVQLLTNVTYVQMREAVRKFSQKLSSGPKDQTVGLFYFAGHGVQFENENYLVPIDATVEFGDDIPRMCFPVQRMVLANMELTNSRMNIVILDACRNNPFPAATRSIEHGLTEMRRARGSFIAYATAPGSVAYDGTGRNGLYTQELLNAVRKPGLTIEQVFKEVRANVLRLSDSKQNTWDSSNIVGEFYFKWR